MNNPNNHQHLLFTSSNRFLLFSAFSFFCRLWLRFCQCFKNYLVRVSFNIHCTFAEEQAVGLLPFADKVHSEVLTDIEDPLAQNHLQTVTLWNVSKFPAMMGMGRERTSTLRKIIMITIIMPAIKMITILIGRAGKGLAPSEE